ncbi:hypothetical protein [Paenibacillus soyae]|uniref:Uncharacterized protein n=1 Tax=Paenibacillus soyae TaxID=2969249 RepID=A0A9X2MMU5_9BACL|nr:hypothetical protein [Paenibacillus soyae]MCR2803591.1 hypothetical protein [Paenibacillus soyae]
MRKSLWFQGEKALVWTGVLGLLLALLCGAGVLLYGTEDTPGAGLAKAFSFNAALGVFMLSTAAIAPMSGMGSKGRAFFRWSYIVLALYSYFAETVQHARGVNPRFVEDGSAFDNVVAMGFALVALLLVVYYLVFAIMFFRRRSYELQPAVVVSIRYAMIAVLLSFAGGIMISVNQGRFLGAEGNLIWFHGLGFHAVQALPFLAWLTLRSSMPGAAGRSLIHISGISFIGGLAAIGWQTLLEKSIWEWTALPLAAVAFFLVAIAAGARALMEAVKYPRVRQTGSADASNRN